MDYERHNALSNIMGLSLPKNFGLWVKMGVFLSKKRSFVVL